jgi:hypothetical protein
MYRTAYDPFCGFLNLFRGFMCCAGGRRFYTRKERIEELEQLKERLQQDLSGVEELIGDLKKQEAK